MPAGVRAAARVGSASGMTTGPRGASGNAAFTRDLCIGSAILTRVPGVCATSSAR